MKNSRRQGAGKADSSMRWIASTSARVAGSMISRSRILLLLQLHLGLGQPHVDRRDVAIALPFTALLELQRAPRAAERHVAVLQKVGDADHAPFRRRIAE